jgi:hypothetical protein
MNAPASFKDTFFITRHSANLMQDLQRQISTAGAICLVYGIEGIGKTRLIRQFISTRIAGRKVNFCRLVSDGFFLNDETQLHTFESLMTHLLNSPSNNSILVVDQLEQAPGKFIQQLLHFWAQSANNLNLALILGCRPQHLSTVYKISETLKLSIPSVELTTLSRSESLQYLSAQLCPNLNSVPDLSKELSREIKIAGGVPELLNRIISRYTGIIECNQQNPDLNKTKVMFMIAVLVMAIGLGIYFNSIDYGATNNQSAQKSEERQMSDFQTTIIKEPENTSTPVLAEPVIVEKGALIADKVEPELDVPAEIIISSVDQEFDAESMLQAGSINNENITEQKPEPQNLLQERLFATQEWLRQSTDITASIQIMTLSLAKDPEKSLLRFLHRLVARSINLNQVYIYRLKKETSHVFVVLFGSFVNRSEARSQLNSLPSGLKANSPVVRTVLGIKKEIENGKT